MLVLKFGGTSVGTADRMKEVISIIQMQSSDQKLVVLSAMSGTTNALVDIGQLMYDGKRTEAKMSCQSLQHQYDQVRHDLFTSNEYLIKSKEKQ